jgi:hypothetical protein
MRRSAVALLALAPAVACTRPPAADAPVGATPQAAAAPASGATPASAATPASPAARPQAPASPRDTARGTVGGVSVLVDYGRPYKKGRTIFAADGLAPYGRVWRTGANAATTLVTSADLFVGETRVPAGTYTLYTVPAADRWQLVINRQTGQWGTDYDQARDLARVPMRVTALGAPVEQFTVAVEGNALAMRWDTVQASVALRPAGR